MITKQYAQWYILLFVIAIVAAAVPMALSGRIVASAVVVALIVAVVVPIPLIWLVRKMGYPIGEPIFCPRCGTQVATFRQPKSLSQALWGGYQCPSCGAAIDARGREVTTDTAR